MAGNSLGELIRADAEIAILYARCAARHAAVVDSYNAVRDELQRFNQEMEN